MLFFFSIWGILFHSWSHKSLKLHEDVFFCTKKNASDMSKLKIIQKAPINWLQHLIPAENIFKWERKKVASYCQGNFIIVLIP